MSEREKRKQVAKISVFITSIFVIFLSISYAFINQTLTGTKRQVITAGNLQLELKEGDAITLENALPMYDEVGMIQKSFDFTLRNKMDSDTNYTLKLVDITPEGTQKLDTALVKYGLTKDGAKSIDLLSKLKNGVLDTGTIAGNQTIEYSLRLWIDSSVANESFIKEKNLSYRIQIESNQEVANKEPGGTLKVIEYTVPRNVPICDDKFCSYGSSVTSFVFEPKIDIPSTVDEDKKWDVSEEQNGSVMAYLEEDGTLENGDVAYRMHVQGENGVYANPNSTLLFIGFDKITTIEGLEYLNTSKVTSMNSLFYECSSLENLDLSSFDTSKVTEMEYMFYNCSSLTNLNLDSFDTSNVTDMSTMFCGCSSLKNLNLSSFNTSNVTNMYIMFSECSSLESLDISAMSFHSLEDQYISLGFDSLPTTCAILAKDEEAKNWILGKNSELTNITIKEA